MLKLKSINLKKEKVTTLFIPVCRDRNIHDDKAVSGLVKAAKKVKEFKGSKNQDLVFSIKKSMKKFRDLQFIKVRGHAGDEGNEMADRLATDAVKEHS